MKKPATSAAASLHVGQRVHLRDVNERRLGGRPRMGTVRKVGRVLVSIEPDTRQGRWERYRIETQGKDDKYGHGWFQTERQHADELRRQQAVDTCTRLGVLRFSANARENVDLLEDVALTLALRDFEENT